MSVVFIGDSSRVELGWAVIALALSRCTIRMLQACCGRL